MNEPETTADYAPFDGPIIIVSAFTPMMFMPAMPEYLEGVDLDEPVSVDGFRVQSKDIDDA